MEHRFFPVSTSVALPPFPSRERVGVRGHVADQARSSITINPRELEAAHQAKLKPVAPTWWRLTLTLHQGVTVIRNLTEKPDAANILECGWFESEPNGDEFAVGYDSIATVRVQGFTGPMTGSST